MRVKVVLYSLCLSIFCALCLAMPITANSQTEQPAPSHRGPEKLTLTRAVMCERIKGYRPVNPAIVFSIEIGKVSCFVSFDPVPEDTYIYQKWYHRDKLSTSQRLLLKFPRWSTFGSIQLREADKGPWRVEITDQTGIVLHALRFSIVD